MKIIIEKNNKMQFSLLSSIVLFIHQYFKLNQYTFSNFEFNDIFLTYISIETSIFFFFFLFPQNCIYLLSFTIHHTPQVDIFESICLRIISWKKTYRYTSNQFWLLTLYLHIHNSEDNLTKIYNKIIIIYHVRCKTIWNS